MLKQMITWDGFDGKQANRTLYFNLTRYEIAHDMELEVLEQRFKRFQEDVIGDEPNRDMTPPEIREMLDIFKVLVKHAYGVRSEDGKRFSKNEEIWDEFVETGAFDAFIWYMFEDASRANAFMNGIWPKEVQEAAEKVRQERPNVHLVEDVSPALDVATDDDVPSIDGAQNPSWKNFSEQELINMPEEAFQFHVNEASNGKNVPYQLLAIGMKRKSQTE
jgi:hypothetical protein